jgi:hypothetical protein
MSYRIKEVNALITDMQCFREALASINATYDANSYVLTLQNGTTYQLIKSGQMLKYKWREPDYQSSTHDISWWEELRLAYSAAEKEKQEALRREKERVAKKQKELAELTKRTNAAIKNKVDSNKAAELEAERKAMEAELADAEASQSNAEEVLARIQAAKREIADSRVEEITKVATKLKYKTQINHLTNKRKTRMKLTW